MRPLRPIDQTAGCCARFEIAALAREGVEEVIEEGLGSAHFSCRINTLDSPLAAVTTATLSKASSNVAPVNKSATSARAYVAAY